MTNAVLNTTCERGSSGKFVPAGTRVTVISWAKIKDDGHCLVRVGSYGKAFDTLQANVTRDGRATCQS